MNARKYDQNKVFKSFLKVYYIDDFWFSELSWLLKHQTDFFLQRNKV